MAVRPALALCVFLSACNAPEPPASTGGTSEPAGACGRGVTAVHSDHISSNVSLLAVDGRVLSPSFLSSATGGGTLSTPIGGDVALPTAAVGGDEIVLIDRYPASVLTWVNVRTAAVRAQLEIGERTNPHDYVALSEHEAYVPRFEENDFLIVDPSVPAIIGEIELSDALAGEDPKFSANPGRAARIGDFVYVVLEGYAPGFVNGSAASRVVRVDPATRSVSDVLVLDAAHSCSALAIAPDERELAVACSGVWNGGPEPDPAFSSVVRVGIEGGLAELGRFGALELGGAPFGQALDYAAQQTLVATRLGREDGRPDTLVEIDVASGAARELVSSAPFSLGDVRCAAACGACFASDADRHLLYRFEVASGGLEPPLPLVADTVIGLPPTWIGRF